MHGKLVQANAGANKQQARRVLIKLIAMDGWIAIADATGIPLLPHIDFIDKHEILYAICYILTYCRCHQQTPNQPCCTVIFRKNQHLKRTAQLRDCASGCLFSSAPLQPLNALNLCWSLSLSVSVSCRCLSSKTPRCP